MPSSEELKPCPFCGGKAQLTNVRMSGHQFKVGCYNELCWRPGTDYYGCADHAIAAWNTRAHPAPTAADTPTYSNPDEETQMRLAEEQQMYADTAADAGLVERLEKIANDWRLEAERLQRRVMEADAAIRAAEQREAAAREQNAALEQEVKRLQSDVRETLDHDGRG